MVRGWALFTLMRLHVLERRPVYFNVVIVVLEEVIAIIIRMLV